MDIKVHPNFTLDEMRCKDGTPVPKEYEANAHLLLFNLQVLRDDIGEPVQLLSGYRSPAHNKKVGGKPQSKHKEAAAGDITAKSFTPKQLKARIEKLIKAGKMQDGGIGLYPGFVHYDVGKPRRW